MLSKGTDNGDGTWTLDESQLDGLKLLPDNGYIGYFQLQITAISKESGVDETATISKQVQSRFKSVLKVYIFLEKYYIRTRQINRLLMYCYPWWVKNRHPSFFS